MFGEETIEPSLAEEKHWTDKFPYLKDEKYPLLFQASSSNTRITCGYALRSPGSR
jgi:hypothetical protein